MLSFTSTISFIQLSDHQHGRHPNYAFLLLGLQALLLAVTEYG
jgi:hypothetical protein